MASHMEVTGPRARILAGGTVRVRKTIGRGHGHAAHEEHLKKPIGFADASRRLKLSIRDAIRRSGLIPDYNFYRGRDMNRNTAWRRKVAVHSTDSVYQMRATRLVAQRYLLM